MLTQVLTTPPLSVDHSFRRSDSDWGAELEQESLRARDVRDTHLLEARVLFTNFENVSQIAVQHPSLAGMAV